MHIYTYTHTYIYIYIHIHMKICIYINQDERNVRHYLNAALVLPVITLIASWEMMHLGTHTYEYIYIYIL